MDRRGFVRTVAAGSVGAVGMAVLGKAARAQAGPAKQVNQIYMCNTCGNVVEIARPGKGNMKCCETPMTLLPEKMQDVGYEKHVPVIQRTADGVKVKVGGSPHPMVHEHYIEWVGLITDDGVHRQYLKPGGVPEATFRCAGANLSARAFCNLHLLWKGFIVLDQTGQPTPESQAKATEEKKKEDDLGKGLGDLFKKAQDEGLVDKLQDQLKKKKDKD